MRAFATLVMAGMAATMSFGATAADRNVLVVGAGEVTGYYYPAAGALCRVLNKERPNGSSCAVAPSSGTAANVAALRAGQIDLAILQSRAAVLAANGGEGFKEAGPFPELRALMSLHGEAVLVLAREGSNIRSLADLKGKRVNLGRPGSFQRAMAEIVLDAAGISEGELSPAVELDLNEQGPELCEGNIDAAFYTGVHPMPEAASAIEDCNAAPVPVKSKELDGFLKKNVWLSRAAVKAGTYDGMKDEVASLGLKAVLAASAAMPVDEAYAIVKGIHSNFGAFTRLHPVLRGLGKGETARDGIAIELHEGAEKFYSESGLNK